MALNTFRQLDTSSATPSPQSPTPTAKLPQLFSSSIQASISESVPAGGQNKMELHTTALRQTRTTSAMDQPNKKEMAIALAAISFLSLSLFVFATAKQKETYTILTAMLGGVGGLSLLGHRCLDQCWLCHEIHLSFVVVGSAAVLHIAAFGLGIEAIQYYYKYPAEDWGPTFATHGAWWWIGLMILLCICNLMASVIGVWLVYHSCRRKI